METASRASRLRFGVLLIVVFCLPFSGYSYRIEYWGPLMLVVLLLAFWQSFAQRELLGALRRLDLEGRIVGGALMAVAAYMAVQTLGISVHSHLTLSNAIKALSYLSLYVLVVTHVNTESRARLLLWTIVAAGVVQALLGATQSLQTGEPAVGSYANRNLLAGFLEMTLAAAIALVVADMAHHSPGRKSWRARVRMLLDAVLSWKMLARLMAAVMVVALILTRSRMGNTAFFLSLMMAAVVGLLIFRQSNRGVIVLFGSILVIDALLLGTFFGLDRLQERMENLEVDRGRLEVNRTFLPQSDRGSDEVDGDPAGASVELDLAEASWLRVLTGYGAGTFYTIYPALQTRETSGVFMPYAHNEYLQFALEYGIFGFTGFLIIGAAYFRRVFREFRRGHGQFRKAVRLGSLMAVVSLMIHSTVDFNLQYFPNAATLCVFLALAFCEFDRKGRVAPK